MRKSVKVAGTVTAILLSGGIAAASAYPGAPAVKAATQVVPEHKGNIACAKDNVRTFVVFNKVCPAGYFWVQIPAQDIAGLGAVGVPGPAGPAGPKGEQGASSIVVKSGSVTLAPTDSTEAQAKTVTITGLPAFEPGAVEATADNGSALTSPADLVVKAVPPASGSTTRSFKVYVTGLTGAASFTAKITVIAVP